ncbi:transposase [Bradyrhizobium sp. 160]|nr:transposase [Bradyrhizobium sp. 160]
MLVACMTSSSPCPKGYTLKECSPDVLTGVFWQRGYVHFLRNALDYVRRKVDDDCLLELRWMYDRRDLSEVRRVWRPGSPNGVANTPSSPRTYVVRILPNAQSCLRPVRALAAERHEACFEEHRYLNMDLLKEYKKGGITPGGLLRPPRGCAPPFRRSRSPAALLGEASDGGSEETAQPGSMIDFAELDAQNCPRSFLRSDALFTIVGAGLHSGRRIPLGARCRRTAGRRINRPGMTLWLRLGGRSCSRVTGGRVGGRIIGRIRIGR